MCARGLSHGPTNAPNVVPNLRPGVPMCSMAPQHLGAGKLSEVDLSDLENLKVRVNDPAGDVQVELDRVLVEVWYPQPVAEGQVAARRVRDALVRARHRRIGKEGERRWQRQHAQVDAGSRAQQLASVREQHG